MATHSSVLAWRIPGMGEPGGLLSTGSHRAGHDWSDLAAASRIDESGYIYKLDYQFGWCHPTISSSVVPFSSHLQSFPASGSFPMSQFFASGGQKYWSFSFSISPFNEYLGPISFRIDCLDLFAAQGTLESSPALQLKSINFFSTQPSLWSNSHICTWLLEKS